MKSQTQSATLKLTYGFVSNPNPIIVATDNTLRVIVTNPTDNLILIDSIEIVIPVGEETAAKLSTNPNLPTPTYDLEQPWSITTSGSVIRIESSLSGPLEIGAQSITFELPNIAVNAIEGNVTIAIYEQLNNGQSFEDSSAYTLTKQEADFPVLNFYADPQILYENGQTTTLFWDVSERGKNCYYKLHAPTWSNATTYTWEDGATGVSSEALFDTTEFTLEILEKNGGDTIKVGELNVTVPVVAPEFITATYTHEDSEGIKRLVTLHWQAANTAYCEIKVDDETVVAQAPASTEAEGYPLFVGSTSESNDVIGAKISLVAHAKENNSITVTEDLSTLLIANIKQYTMDYPTPPIKTTHFYGENTFAIGITPNGAEALIMAVYNTKPESTTGPFQTYINRVTLGSYTMTACQLPNEVKALRVSNVVAPNNAFAYAITNVWGSGGSVAAQLHTIDLGSNKPTATAITYGQVGLSVSPEPQYFFSARSPYDADSNEEATSGLVATQVNQLANTQQITSGNGEACFTAISPNGTKAVMINYKSNNMVVYDITQRATNSITVLANLPVGAAPVSCAITPDSTLALIANSGGNHVSVVNLTNLTVETTDIPVSNPYSIAIMSQRYAFVASKNTGHIHLIDIQKRTCIDGVIAMGALAAAITLDKKSLLTIRASSKTLTRMLIEE